MTDKFENNITGLTSPGENHFSVTPSDSTDFTNTARALYVGGAGDVAIVAKDGTAVTYSSVTAGSIIPVRCIRVNSTNTTASNIVGIY